jgi:octanoyl-[GcvH]:protein N-octanoyltransferase
MRVYDDAFHGDAALDVAVSRALLERVARGEHPECLRLYRPDDVVAFSGSDRTRAGFPAAVAAARGAGFDAALRLAGGAAAVFHRESIAFAWCLPERDARRGIRARFETLAGWVVAALGGLGVDARVGEVEGEYCPGDYSVNAGGKRKLMGVGQRIVSGAAHVGGVLVVADGARVRAALVPVYAALGIPWRPETAGAADDVLPGVTWQAVRDAFAAEIGRAHALEPASLDPELVAAARALAPRYRA